MAKVVITFKAEEDVKQKFDQVCDELGITMTAAINIFMKQVIIQGKIPFEVTNSKKIRTDFVYQDGEKHCMIEMDQADGNHQELLEYMKIFLEKQPKEPSKEQSVDES